MKRILPVLTLCLFVSAAYSQTFRQGVGLSAHCGFLSNEDNDLTFSSALNYTPRFHFMEKKNISLSVGLPVSVGFSGGYSYDGDFEEYDSNDDVNFMINAPLMIDFNWGAGANRETKKRFGLFVGVGAGFHYGDFLERKYDADNLYYYTQNRSVASFGHAVNFGMRFATGRRQKNIELRFSIHDGVNKPRATVLGVGTHFNF